MRRLLSATLIILVLAVAFVPFASAQTTVLTQTILGGQGRTGGSPPPPGGNPSGGPFTEPGTSLVIVENWWSEVVSFHAVVGPNVTAVTWYFGDGTSASGIDVTHSYSITGFYMTYRAKANICTPTMCEDLWQTVSVFNGPLIVEAALASGGAIVLGLIIASVLRRTPGRRRIPSRSKVLRRRMELGGRVHARSIAWVKTLRFQRKHGRV